LSQEKADVNGSRPTQFSPRERILLGLVIGANLLTWGALIVALAIRQNHPASMREVAPSFVSARASPVASTPTWTSIPTAQANNTPTPLQPTATSTATPLLTPTPVRSTIVGGETTVIALLGTDESRQAQIWRTDSILLVLINERSQRVGILSIPRDLWVFVPGHGHARINTVDALGERTNYPGGGKGLLDQTLRHNLDIPIDHYVRIDFRGFEDLIDELGGVTIDVQAPINDRFPDPLHPSGWTQFTVSAGPQHMDGHTALNYCRSRMTSSDFDRSRRQQQVIVALASQLLALDTLVRAPSLWEAYHDTVDTDLSMVEAVRLAYVVQGIGLENLRTRELGADTTTGWITPSGAQVLLPRIEPIQAAVRELLSASG
jgi:LCP family protein required for cell wall assembly